VSIEELKQEIDSKRKLMIEAGAIHGFTAEQTVKISQELDELLICYQKLDME